MGLTYVSVDTPDGVLHLPNAGMLSAAVGPITPTPADASTADAPRG